MTIYLQNYAGDPRAIRKSVSTLATLTGTLRNESNVVNPEILIDTTGISLTGFNYAEIPDFSRKYFVEEIRAVRTGITQIRLRCDPLASFAGQIIALPCIAIRTATKERQSPYIFDSKRPMAAYQVYKTFELFTFTGMGPNVILVTVG